MYRGAAQAVRSLKANATVDAALIKEQLKSIERLEKDIKMLQTQIFGSRGAQYVQTLETDNASLAARIDLLKKKEQQYMDEILDLRNTITRPEARRAMHQPDLQSLRKECNEKIECLKASHNETVQHLKLNIGHWRDLQTQSEREIWRLQALIKAAPKPANPQEVRNLKATCEQYAKKIQTLQATCKQYDMNIARLQADRVWYEQEFGRLQANNAWYEQEVRRLQATQSPLNVKAFDNERVATEFIERFLTGKTVKESLTMAFAFFLGRRIEEKGDFKATRKQLLLHLHPDHHYGILDTKMITSMCQHANNLKL